MANKATRSNTIVDELLLEQVVAKLAPKLTAKIEEQIKNLDHKLDNVQQKISGLVDKVTSLEKTVEANKKEIRVVVENLHEHEKYIKTNSLRIHGIKEETNENLPSKLLTLINDVLKIKCNLTEINNVFRIGKIVNEKPRIVMINFVSYMKRSEVYQAKSKLKGTDIFLSEDLSKKCYKLLKEARNQFGPRNVWTHNCRIFVNNGNAVKRITNEADIHEQGKKL